MRSNEVKNDPREDSRNLPGKVREYGDKIQLDSGQDQRS
jgi:hypothetical protein